jgi:hypothetical protein
MTALIELLNELLANELILKETQEKLDKLHENEDVQRILSIKALILEYKDLGRAKIETVINDCFDDADQKKNLTIHQSTSRESKE